MPEIVCNTEFMYWKERQDSLSLPLHHTFPLCCSSQGLRMRPWPGSCLSPTPPRPCHPFPWLCSSPTIPLGPPLTGSVFPMPLLHLVHWWCWICPFLSTLWLLTQLCHLSKISALISGCVSQEMGQSSEDEGPGSSWPWATVTSMGTWGTSVGMGEVNKPEYIHIPAVSS